MKKTIIIIASILAIVLVFGAITTAFNVENAPSNNNNNNSTPPTNTPEEVSPLDAYFVSTFEHPDDCAMETHSMPVESNGTSLYVMSGDVNEITVFSTIIYQTENGWETNNKVLSTKEKLVIAFLDSWGNVYYLSDDGTFVNFDSNFDSAAEFCCGGYCGNFTIDCYGMPEEICPAYESEMNFSENPLFAEFFN